VNARRPGHRAQLGVDLPQHFALQGLPLLQRLDRPGVSDDRERHGDLAFSASATPTTATSAMPGCELMDSSISRVPSLCPATLITSSVRPRMK